MKRIKVSHLTSVHAYNDTRIFHKECVSLAQAGYDVTLIAPVNTAFQEKEVTVLPVGTWSNRYYRFFVTIPRLLVKALKLKASVYHFHDPELLLAAPILRLFGARVIYDIHEDYITSIQQKSYIPALFRKVLASTLGLVEKAASALCYQVIAERYYRERFPDAVEILNYPILPQCNDDSLMELQCEREVKFNVQYAWCLYTGNVTLDRGALLHLDLLKVHEHTAIAYIGKCSEEVAETIYLSADKEKISRQRIKIIGIGRHVPRETIDYYTYSRHWLAGVALFPETAHYAKKELTKFFEYMAAGLPILSSNFPVWRNVIEKNKCGLCANPIDLQSIVKAIDFLLSNPDEAAVMGENGRKAVNEKYNWSFEEKKLLNLYKTVSDRG